MTSRSCTIPAAQGSAGECGHRAPAICVVIPTHDRPEGLRRTLDGLARQTQQGFRVVVVDDCGSIPATNAIADRSYPFPLTVTRLETNRGPAHARNVGVTAAAGADLIAFIDDDVVPIPELLARHLRAWAEAGPGSVVIGPQLLPADWEATPWNRWECECLAVEYRRMEDGEYEPTWRQFFTGNAFLERQAFLDAGAFNESFTRAEDIEFAYRLHRRGARFVFEPTAIGWHYSHRTLSSWREIPRQYARFDIEIDRRYPEMDWLGGVDRERSQRHFATRAATAVLGRTRAESAGAGLAVMAARTLYRTGGTGVAMGLLSAAFSLEYAGARRVLATQDGAGPGNAPSTEPPRLTDTLAP